jgi:hypothetical protein
MAKRSFNTEAGWYHEAPQAFVPEQTTGMKAFVFLRPMKMVFCFVLTALNGSTYNENVRLAGSLAAPCRKSILIGLDKAVDHEEQKR